MNGSLNSGSTGSSGTPSPSFFPVKPGKVVNEIKDRWEGGKDRGWDGGKDRWEEGKGRWEGGKDREWEGKVRWEEKERWTSREGMKERERLDTPTSSHRHLHRKFS